MLTLAVALATSHCELGGMKPLAPAGHSCCSKTPSTSPIGDFSSCCVVIAGALPANVAAPVTSWTPEVFSLAPLSRDFGLLAVAPPVGGDAPGLEAAAPPRLHSLLFSRLSPAHAPPSEFVI